MTLASSAIAGLLGFYVLMPDVRIVRDQSEDATDAFKQTFNIENDSIYAIHNVESGCSMINVKDTHGGGMSGFSIINGSTSSLDGGYVDYLSHGGTTTFRCSMNMPGVDFSKLEIGADVYYDLPLPFLHRRCKRVIFVGRQNTRGEYSWAYRGEDHCVVNFPRAG